MLRKNTLLALTFLIIFIIIIYTPAAIAGWTASLTAEGQAIGEAFKKTEIIIGVSTVAETKPAAPEPPEIYTVLMYLHHGTALENLTGRFYSDIKDNDTADHGWVIGINPSGNVMPPAIRTSIIRWNPLELGNGDFVLMKGVDGSGGIAVSDMKSVSQYAVTGENSWQYFLITNKPDLSYAISILQITAGISPADFDFFMDVDQDEKIGLPEAVYMLQDVAGLR